MGINTELPSYRDIASVSEREELRTSRNRWRVAFWIAATLAWVMIVIACPQ